MIKYHGIKCDLSLSKPESPDSGVLLTPDCTCNLAFSFVFIVLPTSKDLTQVRMERNGSKTVTETSVYNQTSVNCVSHSR